MTKSYITENQILTALLFIKLTAIHNEENGRKYQLVDWLHLLNNSGLIPIWSDYILFIRTLLKHGFIKEIKVWFSYYSDPGIKEDFWDIQKTYTYDNIWDIEIDQDDFCPETQYHSITLQKIKERLELWFFTYIESIREEILQKKKSHLSYAVQMDKWKYIQPSFLITKIDLEKINIHINSYISLWEESQFKKENWVFLKPKKQIQYVSQRIQELTKDYWESNIIVDRKNIAWNNKKNNYKNSEIDFIAVMLYLENQWYIKIQNFDLEDSTYAIDLKFYISVNPLFHDYVRKIQYISDLEPNTLVYFYGKMLDHLWREVSFSKKQDSLLEELSNTLNNQCDETEIQQLLYGDEFNVAGKLWTLLGEINKKCKNTFWFKEQFIKHSGWKFFVNPKYQLKTDKNW